VEDYLGILMFLLFVGASLFGRMKKAQGPRPPFDPRTKPTVVEAEEEEDPFEDLWQPSVKPQPQPEPVAVKAQPAASVKKIERRPIQVRQTLEERGAQFTGFRSSFQVDQPVELEDLSDEGSGAIEFGSAQDLAQAVVMSEVLGKPRALRSRRY